MEMVAFAALAAIIGLAAQRTGLLQLPIVALGIYVLMTLASRYQSLINLPISIDRDAPEVRRLLQSLAITLKLVIVLIFVYIEWILVNTASGRSSTPGTLFLPVTLVAVFLPLGFYLHKLQNYQR